MSTKKVILKTAPKRKGTIQRSKIRAAVQAVFGSSATRAHNGRSRATVPGTTASRTAAAHAR